MIFVWWLFIYLLLDETVILTYKFYSFTNQMLKPKPEPDLFFIYANLAKLTPLSSSYSSQLENFNSVKTRAKLLSSNPMKLLKILLSLSLYIQTPKKKSGSSFFSDIYLDFVIYSPFSETNWIPSILNYVIFAYLLFRYHRIQTARSISNLLIRQSAS